MEERIREATGLMKKVNNFYDTRAKTWYGEATKHLVPTYTTNKLSDKGGLLITSLGMIIDVGEIVGYTALIGYVVSKIAN